MGDLAREASEIYPATVELVKLHDLAAISPQINLINQFLKKKENSLPAPLQHRQKKIRSIKSCLTFAKQLKTLVGKIKSFPIMKYHFDNMHVYSACCISRMDVP